MEKLLILNPGSTSTKIAYYEDEKRFLWRAFPIPQMRSQNMT